MPSRDWRSHGSVARSGLILLALLCLSAAQAPPNAENHHSDAKTYQSKPEPAAPPKMERGPTYVLNSDARQEPPNGDFLNVPWDGWVAIFTGVLTAATIGLGWATFVSAKAAKAAADALPILERAYIYPEIVSDGVLQALHQRVLATGPEREMWDVNIALQFRNFGKTPGRLRGGEVDFHIVPPTNQVGTGEWVIGNRAILASGEAGERIVRRCRPATDVSREIMEGRRQLFLVGWIRYRDIWDKERADHFAWVFNPTVGLMVPTDDGGRGQGRRA
jgi:hypothetical protein